MKEMSEGEKKRVTEQRESLGEEGLKRKRQRLEKATDENEVNIDKLITKRFMWVKYLESLWVKRGNA